MSKHHIRKTSPATATVILLITSILSSLFLAELFIREHYPKEIDTKALQQDIDNTRISSFTRPSNNRDIVYEFIPDVQTQWQGVTVRSSKDGYYRISAKAPRTYSTDNTFKLAVVGDSTAFGWKVQYEETYAYLLKKKIEKKINRKVELRNYSLPGYNSHQLLAIFKSRVVPWKPNLTILHYDHNDADPVKEKPPNYIPPEYGDNIIHSALIKFTMRRIRYKYNQTLTTAIKAKDNNETDLIFHNYRYAGPQYRKHLLALQELATQAQQADIPIVCFIFNTFTTLQADPEQDKMYSLLHKPLVPKLRNMGYIVVDSYPLSQKIFRQRGWKDWSHTWISKKDAHPNPLGHKIIAGMIWQRIKKTNILYQKIQ